ncbi:MAG: hypothetical protein ACYSSO_15435, partial [Planctomycetota bacterium]
MAVSVICLNNTNGKAQHIDTNEPFPHQKKQQPIIMWFHNGVTDSPKALKLAISSRLVSHVMIKYMHRADRDW